MAAKTKISRMMAICKKNNAEFIHILAEESDSQNQYDDNDYEIIVSETDNEESQLESEDEVPLATFPQQRTKNKKKQKEILRWQEKFLNVPNEEVIFKGSESLPRDISQRITPYQFFEYIFTPEVLSYITQETNLYSVQIRSEKPANISEEEIKAFIGICIYMSILHLPSTRSYWNNSMEIPAISQTMTCNRFEEIKRFLHFNNNDD